MHKTLHLLHRYAIDEDLRLASAESCTGGRLASLLTALPRASSYFASGVVCYNDEIKTQILGIDPAWIAQYTAVSPEVASAMAEGVARLMQCEVGVSTTGYLGPMASIDSTAIGTVYVGLYGWGRNQVHRLSLSGTREQMAQIGAEQAIEYLWRFVRMYHHPYFSDHYPTKR